MTEMLHKDMPPYPSETSKHRDALKGFCEGTGLDLGYGGDPIVPEAITLDGFDRVNCGDHPQNIIGDALILRWFRSEQLDYVYSSHLLEDFEDTARALREWFRVLRKGGRLVILCPDQQKYEAHCRKDGTEPNPAHKHSTFGLEFVKQRLPEAVGSFRVIHERDADEDYSFELVVEKA